ncbi:MAG: thioredoxin domain-containing protein [Candidatus Vogelbacteria bacterium]|nr:thioredoxin domain-containing protein [Candidatus Vogelbacteria bacterium]
MDEHNNQTKIEITVPMAIIIAGIFIAGAIVVAKGQNVAPVSPTNQIEPVSQSDINLKAVDSGEHIRGSISAPIKIVEFSDPECPFCKRFHSTMKQVMDNYGTKGEVAWVYRDFPLDSLHPKARKESEALECAANIGGNEIFWKYLDRLMEITPSNNQLDPVKLNEIADYVKLDQKQFTDCLKSSKFASKVQAGIDDATAAGGRGTPYSVVISASGKKIAIDGAYPYESVAQTIDQVLAGK